MATIVYAQGDSGEITIPANEKIAVFSWSPVQVLQVVGYPNFPTTLDLIETTTAGEEYVSSAFASGATIVLRTSAAQAFYEVGAAPVIGEPSPDITAAATPWVLAGLGAAQGGSAQLKGGTSSTSGNAGGAASLTGGQPGATGVGGAAAVAGGAGGATSGKGGAATVTGGAGTAGNASGGSVVLTGGAKHGSGLDGAVINRGTFQLYKQGTPATATDTATLTVAQVLAGIILATPTAAANYTLPTGADLEAAMPTDIATGDSFDLTIINLGGSGDDITILTGVGITVTGGGSVVVTVAAPAQGTFTFRRTGSGTFQMYRRA
jgi:hypothetical protein